MGHGSIFRRLSIDIPAGQKKENAKEDSFTLKRPHTISGVILSVPPGHEFDAAYWLERNRGTWLPDDGGEIRLDDATNFPIIDPADPEAHDVFDGGRARYALKGYNDDSNNDHELQAFIIGRWGTPDGRGR